MQYWNEVAGMSVAAGICGLESIRILCAVWNRFMFYETPYMFLKLQLLGFCCDLMARYGALSLNGGSFGTLYTRVATLIDIYTSSCLLLTLHQLYYSSTHVFFNILVIESISMGCHVSSMFLKRRIMLGWQPVEICVQQMYYQCPNFITIATFGREMTLWICYLAAFTPTLLSWNGLLPLVCLFLIPFTILHAYHTILFLHSIILSQILLNFK